MVYNLSSLQSLHTLPEKSEDQRNMGLAPAGIMRNLSFNNRTEDHKNEKKPGSVTANTSSVEPKGTDTISSAIDSTSSVELKGIGTISSAIDNSVERNHRFWLGSALHASTSNAEMSESAHSADGPTEIVDRTSLRTVCAHCESPTHHSTCCPHLLCSHCEKMGHVGINCPRRAEEANQKKREARRRYKEKKAAARIKVSPGALCSNCKKPDHQRTACPDLPCRHCELMGHVGTNCPLRKEVLGQAARDSKRRYKERMTMARSGTPSANFHKALCSHCTQPSHRRPACPQLPCTHCSTAGHVVTVCPVKAEEVRQRMRDARSRHKKRRDTVAGVPPSTALCTQCKQSGHRKPTCPNLPCRHCGEMGHIGVGTNCPVGAKGTAQGLRESSERYRQKKTESTSERVEISSGSEPILLVENVGRELD